MIKDQFGHPERKIKYKQDQVMGIPGSNVFEKIENLAQEDSQTLLHKSPCHSNPTSRHRGHTLPPQTTKLQAAINKSFDLLSSMIDTTISMAFTNIDTPKTKKNSHTLTSKQRSQRPTSKN